jgi:hypothetical protein
MPHRFLQEALESAGMAPESTRMDRNLSLDFIARDLDRLREK